MRPRTSDGDVEQYWAMIQRLERAEASLTQAQADLDELSSELSGARALTDVMGLGLTGGRNRFRITGPYESGPLPVIASLSGATVSVSGISIPSFGKATGFAVPLALIANAPNGRISVNNYVVVSGNQIDFIVVNTTGAASVAGGTIRFFVASAWSE